MATDRINLDDFLDPRIRKELDALNKELKQTISAMGKLTTEANKLNKSFSPKNINQVTQSRQKLNKVQQESTNQQKRALTAAEKYRQKINQLSAEEERLKMELQEKRKQMKAQVQYNSAAAGSINKLNAANKILRERLKGVNQETERGRKRANALRSAIDQNDKKINTMSDSLTRQKRNIGNYSSALEGLPGPLGQAASSAKMFGGTLRALSKIPIVLLITSIVAALAGLVKLFSSTDAGGTKLQATMNGLKGVLAVLKNTLLDFVKNVRDRFSIVIKRFQLLWAQIKGNKEQAAELREEISELSDNIDKRQPFKNLGQRAKAAFTEIRDLTFQMDELNDRMIAAISSQKELELEMERFRALAKDQTRADQERLRFFELALDRARKYYGNQREFAREEFENMVTLEAAKREVSEETVRQLIKMNDEQAMDARETNEEIAKFWNEAGDDTVRALEEAYVKMLNADTQYAKMSRELISQLTGFKKRMMEEEEDAQEEKIEVMIEFERQMTERFKGLSTERIDASRLEMEGIRETLRQTDEMEQEFHKKKRDRIEKEKQLREQVRNASLNGARELAQTIFQYRAQELQIEQQMAVEKAKARGASEEEITKIEKKYARQRKKDAVTKAIINGALAVTNALATTPFPASLIVAAVVAAKSALEVATIKAQKFAKGTKDSGSRDQVAWVGEEGTEAVREKSGNVWFTPDEPTLMPLKAHSEVIPNRQLQHDMAMMAGAKQEDDREERRHKEIMKALNRDKKETYVNVTEKGFGIAARKGNNWTNYIDRKYRG